MADAVTTQILYDSPDAATMKFTNISDGTGESAVLKVDVSTLSPPCNDVVLEKILYATDGMGLRILWDATADSVAWLVPTGQHGSFDFRELQSGGIANNAGAGKTGDVLFTTVGHTSGDSYSVILEMRKRR